MLSILFLMLQAAFAAALAWSCFCRLVKTDSRTVREILLAIWFEGLAAGFVMLAPVMPLLWPAHCHWPAWSTPTWIWLLLLLAAGLVQIATARYWRDGVPDDFSRS